MDREKLTVTISKELFAQIDSVIDGRNIRNRSHAAEYLIRQGLGENKIRTALVLAGGQGTRLRPLTLELPKPMVPVHGRPLLAYTIELLAHHDVKNVIISLGYKGELISEYFGDGSRFGINIKYVPETEPLGTAGPLLLAKRYLKETFLLLNGDILSDIDLSDLIHFHRTQNGLATMALASVDDPASFGAVRLKGSQILEFVEKPQKGQQPTNLINAGYTVCEPGILNYIKKGYQMLESDVYPKLAKDRMLSAYPFSGLWFHIGTTKQYEQALQGWRLSTK